VPDISVIIPAWRPRDFEPLLASMAANADVDAEWIVVDDASGPASDAVFATLPKAVRLIRKEVNARQGAARNTGLAVASGEWVKFLDADDRLDQGHLRALLAVARAQAGTAIPFAPTRHVFPGGRTSDNESWRGLRAQADAQYERLLVRPFLHHCGALFPRDLLQRLQGYDESLITDEDGDLLLRILREGVHFVPVEGSFYYYIHRGGGGRVSSDDDIAKLRARIRVCDKVAASFTPTIPAPVAQALAQRMDRIAMTYWATHPAEAQALLDRARNLAPGYRFDMRPSLLLLRRVLGPDAIIGLTGLYRRLRGRPTGGVQG